MSRISEFEPRRRRDNDREDDKYNRKSRQSWPASAWFVAGTMIALNLGLGAFLVKSELDRGASWDTFRGEHGRRAVPGEATPSPKPVWPAVDAPKNAPQSDVQTPQNPLPAQSSTPEVDAPDASRTDNRNDAGKNRAVQAVPSKTGPVRTRPARKPAAESKRWAMVPTTRQEPARRFIPDPLPQARYATPQVPAVTAPSPTSAPVPVMTPPAVVASARAPTVGTRNQSEPSQRVIAPTAGGTAAKKPQPAIDPTSGQSQKQPIRVASVGLPGMDKGIVVPKTPVGSPSPKIEIVRRPPEPKVDVPNCGGDVVIPCPTLKKRPVGGAPEGDRW